MKIIQRFWRQLVGDPIWTKDYDGEIRASRLKRYGKTVMVKKIFGWCEADDDGSVSSAYIEKWWPR